MNQPTNQTVSQLVSQQDLLTARRLAQEAGQLLLQHRKAGIKVEYKSGPDDPVTIADREASQLILQGLQEAFPDDGFLSEEEPDDTARLTRRRVWIIDPIDGTRSYTEGRPDFCVSIGLAVDGQAALGVIYAPATDELFEGVVGTDAAEAEATEPAENMLKAPQTRRLCVSNTEYNRELNNWKQENQNAPANERIEVLPSHSVALKLARLGYGQGDATFSVAPRHEWDVCAGDAILQAAGGELRRRDGQKICYNQAKPHIEQGIMAGFSHSFEWLAPLLVQYKIPIAHLCLHPTAPAWQVLSGEQQQRWHDDALQERLHLRYRQRQQAPHEFLALMIAHRNDQGQIVVQHSEGNAEQLERLSRNVSRLP